MPHPANQKCENCLYFVDSEECLREQFSNPSLTVDDDESDNQGECRRRSPLAFVQGSHIVEQFWPTTYPDCWCGEWSPAPVNNTEASPS